MFLIVRVHGNVEHIKEMGKEVRLGDLRSLTVLFVKRTLLKDDASHEFWDILRKTKIQ